MGEAFFSFFKAAITKMLAIVSCKNGYCRFVCKGGHKRHRDAGPWEAPNWHRGRGRQGPIGRKGGSLTRFFLKYEFVFNKVHL